MVYLSDELRQVLERYQKGHPEHRIALGGETVEIRENGNGGIKIRRLTVNSPVLFRTLQELKEEQIRQQLPAHLRKSVLPPRSGWLKAILVFDGVETYGIHSSLEDVEDVGFFIVGQADALVNHAHGYGIFFDRD